MTREALCPEPTAVGLRGTVTIRRREPVEFGNIQVLQIGEVDLGKTPNTIAALARELL